MTISRRGFCASALSGSIADYDFDAALAALGELEFEKS
jgi:hypothetical protein